MERWLNKVAVVTGANVGIGHAVVKDLLRNGLRVVGLARRFEKLQETKDSLPPELQKNYTIFKCDVGDVKCVDEVFDKIIEQLGGVDILVNNAGILNFGSIIEGDVPMMQQVMQTNVMGVVHCTKRSYQSMKERNFDGHIVLMNSVLGHSIPVFADIPPHFGMYVMSKHALTAITELYRQEFRHCKTKIKITSVSPGITDTDLVPEWLAEASGRNFLNVEDISSAVMYAISTPPHVQIHEIVVKPVGEFMS